MAQEKATLGGGCFWCLDAVFRDVQGVTECTSGYAGGDDPHPTYEAVCRGQTGHAEVVQLTFHPEEIGFADLLEIFWTIHDPTTPNRQGADVGTQYRSIVLTHDEGQAREAAEVRASMQSAWEAPIVTEIVPLQSFYAAEAYHQNYYAQNPLQGYCRAVIDPKVAKFRSKWAHRLKSTDA